MRKFKTLSLKTVDDILNNETEDIKDNLNFIITVLRDNSICDDVYYLLDKLSTRLGIT